MSGWSKLSRRESLHMAKERTSRGSRSRAPLSRLEVDVMDTVWDLAGCTSAQVVAEFHKKRSLAPTTIRTVLASLRSKGYLKLIPSIDRGFRFRPTVTRQAVARRSLKSLISSLCKNSPHQAISYLLDDAGVTDSDLDEIRQMIEARKRKGRKE